MRKPLVIAVALTVLVLGVAMAAARFLTVANDDAIELAPADAFAYANVFLDPSTDQKIAIRDLLEKFPEAGTPERAKDAIARLINEALRSAGLTFEDDVEPWLGKQIALFMTPPTASTEDPQGAILVATEDPDATNDTITQGVANKGLETEERSYKGVEYAYRVEEDAALGVVDNFLVAGTEKGLRDVVDVSQGAR